jgi:formylglycine-generating enzyme required for sulfatase activity
LAHLNDLTNLEYLHLGTPGNVTDAGLAHLVGLVSLRHLDLGRGARVTDAGLDHLKKMTNLSILSLDSPTVTRDGIEKLRAALPACLIEIPAAPTGNKTGTPAGTPIDSLSADSPPAGVEPAGGVALPVLPEAEAIRSQFTTEVTKVVRDEQAARTSAGNKAMTAILRARPSNIEKLKETVPAKLEVDLAKLRVEAERKIDAARKKALAELATLRNKLVVMKDPIGVTGIDQLVREIKDSNPLVDLASLTNSVGMELAWIPPGTFLMGSPRDEVNRGDDEEQHEVTITRAFYIGVHEVTQGQYEKVIGKNPAAFKEGNGGGANHPVDSVSWHDAEDFCKRLSELPAEKAAGRNYRLPTEAEWEYACRAGTTTPYNDGDPARRRMLVTRSFFGETAAVGSQKSNRFGLYDMHGNVQEWCADWYGPYPTGRQVDPTGPATGTGRVIRGGWHEDGRNEVGSAERAELAPVFPIDDMGFRVVCNLTAREAGILVPSSQSANPERAVAEWVYSVGGKVSLDGAEQECQDVKDLPAGRLRVTGLTLGFTQVTDADLARLAPLGELTRLHLHGCNIGDDGMAHLKTHKRLTWLSLWDTNVGDAGMQNLAGLADLDYLTLNGTRVTDAGLAQVSGLAKLKVLHLAALSGVTGDGLRHVRGLQGLEYLDLHDTSIDDQGLPHLAGLMNLRTLILSETSTGDNGLAAIKPLKNLRLLNLTGTKITDAGLRHCEGLINLRELSLDHTSASPAGVQKLQKALPFCTVTAVKP